MDALPETAPQWRPFEPSREAQAVADFLRLALTLPNDFCWGCRRYHVGAGAYMLQDGAVITVCGA